MKIGFSGIDWLAEGKAKYDDPRVKALVEKDQPKKVTPYYVEFIQNEFVHCDSIVLTEERLLDVLIPDIEKCETRFERSETTDEKLLMQRCLEYMEKETPLCDGAFNEKESDLLVQLNLISFKPVVRIDSTVNDVTTLIQLVLEKSEKVFFYTSGPKEVHAWIVNKGSDIITCAAKIHTDLARGFIKGDIVHFEDYLNCHNFNDCRKKGVVDVVDRDYTIEDGDIVEIRFNV